MGLFGSCSRLQIITEGESWQELTGSHPQSRAEGGLTYKLLFTLTTFSSFPLLRVLCPRNGGMCGGLGL